MNMMVTNPTQSETTGLDDALTLHPPASLEKAANLVRTSRLREVQLDWGAIIGASGKFDRKDAARAFRRYFEESFGVADMEAKAPPWNDADDVDETEYPNVDPTKAWRKAETKSCFYYVTGHEKPLEVKAGVLLIHGTSKRIYLPLDVEGKPIPSADCKFDGNCVWAQYRDFWERIEALVLVSETADRAKSDPPESSFVGSIAAELKSEWAELESMWNYCDIVEKSASAWGEAAKTDKNYWLQLDSTRETEERYVALGLRKRLVQGLMAQLSKRADDAGLVMPTEDVTITLPGNNNTKPLKRGKVYRPFRRTFTWTVMERREHWEWDGDLGKVFNRKKLVVDYVPVSKSQEGTDYEEVMDEPKPWVEHIRTLRYAEKKDVYVMHLDGDDYVSEEGALLSDILWRCKHDEQARLRIVVALPVFRSSLAGAVTHLGYYFFRSPLEPIKPQRLPRIFLRESLAYAVAWKGSEMGQLVASINLAPGEERTISVTTSAERQSSTVIAKSIGVETATSESYDLSTEIEKEVRRESASQGSLAMSASGSFGIDGFSIGGSSDASYSASVLEVSRDLSKATTRAARSLSRKRSEQYSVTTTTADKSSATSANQLKISNINQGVTANYLLYILNNRFEGAVMIENLQVVVDYGSELILGSGAFKRKTYPLERIEKAIENLRKDDFAISLDDAQFERFKKTMVDAIAELLLNEYGKSRLKSQSTFMERDTSINAFDIVLDEQPEEDTTKGRLRLGTSASTLQQKIKRYRDLTKNAWAGGGAWVVENTRSDISVPSGALYLDTLLGRAPATEPYSEKMRTLEQQKTAAQIESERARAYATRRGWLRGTIQTISTSGKAVTVTLSAALEPGAWVVLYHKAPKHCFEAPSDGTMTTVTFNWPEPTIPSVNDLTAWLNLVNVATGETISAP